MAKKSVGDRKQRGKGYKDLRRDAKAESEIRGKEAGRIMKGTDKHTPGEGK